MFYCTQEGAERFSAKWQELENDLRQTQMRKNEVASSGGIFDNFDYDELMRNEELINAKMRDLNRTISNLMVVDVCRDRDNLKLYIGHIADISINGELKSFRIGGYGDHNPNVNPEVISYLAPIIKLLIGKEVGAEVKVPLVSGIKTVKLVAIRLPKKP